MPKRTIDAGQIAASTRRTKSKAHFYSPRRQSRNLDDANIRIWLADGRILHA